MDLPDYFRTEAAKGRRSDFDRYMRLVADCLFGFDLVCHLLRGHQRGKMRVSPHDRRKYGGIHDTQSINASHAEI